MKDLEVIQVIKTTLLRRGSGKDASSPIRCVTQFWSMDGDLLWEVDPHPVPDGPSETILQGEELLTRLRYQTSEAQSR
jgi:hypothetical protein